MNASPIRYAMLVAGLRALPSKEPERFAAWLATQSVRDQELVRDALARLHAAIGPANARAA